MCMLQWQCPFVVGFLAYPALPFVIAKRCGANMCGITWRALQATARASLRAEPCQVFRITLPLQTLAHHLRLPLAFGGAVCLGSPLPALLVCVFVLAATDPAGFGPSA